MNGQIYAADIDAFSEEPPNNEALYDLDTLIMGCHCAASTVGTVVEHYGRTKPN